MTAPEIATSPVGLDAGAVLASLRRTFEGGRTCTLEWRREQLAALRRMLREREEELVEALRADLGRPTVEAFGADIGHGKAGFDTFSHAKSVLRKPRRPDPKLLYPTYTGIAERLLRRVLR